MLDIQNVSLTLKKDGRVLVRGLSFTLSPGDRMALIGEEGNGKSTLLRFLANPHAVETYCEAEGRVEAHGGRIGYLEQDMPPEDKQRPVRAFFENVDVYDNGLLRELGLAPEWLQSDRPAGTLSGGEKVKLRLAALLATGPDVLLLDEPTNDLDLPSLEWMEGFLRRTAMPVLYISHDETLLERTATGILHLEQVRRKTMPRHTVAALGYADYVRERGLALAKQEQVARKQQANHQAQMERWQQIYNRVDHELHAISRRDPAGGRLLKKKMKGLKSQEKRLEKQADDFEQIPDVEEAIAYQFAAGITLPKSKEVLRIDLERLMAGERELAHGISLYVEGPRHVAILGRNGQGKTTLLRQFWEQLRERTDIRAGYMPQDYDEALAGAAAPTDFLAPEGGKEAVTRACTLLGSLKFTPDEMRGPVQALSGGQKAKLLLARLLLTGCNVLLLDEPTRNLSPLSAPVIRQALASYGGAMVTVTHDRKLMAEVCTEWWELTPAGLVRLQRDAFL